MTTPVILVYSPVPNEAATYAKLLRQSIAGVVLFEATTAEEAAAHLDDIEILIGWKFPENLIDNAPNLRWVHKISAGVEDVLCNLARRPELILSRTDGSAIAPRMVEYVLGTIYAKTQQFHRASAQAKGRVWQPYLVGRASGRTVGVAGLGDIGIRIAQAINRNGMRVVGWRRSDAPLPEGIDKVYRGDGELKSFVAECDFIVSVLPATKDTKHTFAADVFSAMKAEAFFINIGRGDSVDENALADAIENKTIAGAALDVFAIEPLPTDSRLWDLENLVITPHISGPLVPEDVVSSFLENLNCYRVGEPLHKRVDPVRGY